MTVEEIVQVQVSMTDASIAFVLTPTAAGGLLRRLERVADGDIAPVAKAAADEIERALRLFVDGEE